MRLRKSLIAAAIVLAAIFFLALYYGGGRVGAGVALVNCVVLLAALLFERSRYKPVVDDIPAGDWQETGERFVDPVSGRLVRVVFSPSTGERLYVGIRRTKGAAD